MTTEEIIRMAQEAGVFTPEGHCVTVSIDIAERFAALVAAHEREKQAEQEPVAVVEITYGREPECYVTGNIDDFPEGVFKLYAAPVPITTPDVCGEVCVRAKLCYGCGKALDEANKKLAEQAEQEPVAWIEVERGIPMFARFADKYKPTGDGFIPLYTHPVRTKDLTDDEIFEILELQNCPKSELKYWFHDARAVIAADRRKNK